MGSGRGGRLFEAGRLVTFSAFRMGAYSGWALIRGWAPIRINTLGKGLDEQFGKLFNMYKNNRGPIIIPWGITQQRKQDLESEPLKRTYLPLFF